MVDELNEQMAMVRLRKRLMKGCGVLKDLDGRALFDRRKARKAEKALYLVVACRSLVKTTTHDSLYRGAQRLIAYRSVFPVNALVD
jgi:hypothetical protein